MNAPLLITGATGGLGHEVVRQALAAGRSLVTVTRDTARVAARDSGPDSLTVQADVSTEAGARNAIAACEETFGTPPAALVHCAGSTLISPLHRTPESAYRGCLAANLDSAFFTLGAYVSSLLKAHQGGSAVLVSSVVARIGVANHEAIAVAKSGLEGLVRSAAATYSSQGIRVNGVAPGIMRTPSTERLFSSPQMEQQIAAQYPLGRYGTVEDVAHAILWLASDEASWVTGQIIAVDGGFTAVRPSVRSTARA